MSSNPDHSVEGSCHCGHLSLKIEFEVRVSSITRRTCGCEYCRRQSASWISHPHATLTIDAHEPDCIGRYRFGHKTADFLFCRNCGVLIASVCEISGRDHAVVNATALIDHAFAEAPHAGGMDGEGKGDRIARRSVNWIQKVIIHEGQEQS